MQLPFTLLQPEVMHHSQCAECRASASFLEANSLIARYAGMNVSQHHVRRDGSVGREHFTCRAAIRKNPGEAKIGCLVRGDMTIPACVMTGTATSGATRQHCQP